MATSFNVEFDTAEAREKLENLLAMMYQLEALINKSWLLRLLFYG